MGLVFIWINIKMEKVERPRATEKNITTCKGALEYKLKFIHCERYAKRDDVTHLVHHIESYREKKGGKTIQNWNS